MLLGGQKACEVCDGGGGGGDRVDNRDDRLKVGPPAGDQQDLILVSGWGYLS
jgi:hypothetical protein